jgi:hypothetical protein
MALRKLLRKPSCEAGRNKTLSEPARLNWLSRSWERVRFVSAYAVIFSHFSAALIFFATFFYQEKKVDGVYGKVGVFQSA